MSYKITINRIETTTTTQDGKWVVVDKRPWTAKELQEAAGYANEADFAAKNPLKEILGYSPRREVMEKTDIKVFEQVVDDINLPAVIKAVNSIA